jgi:uncharacterized membrane protein
MAEKEKTEIEGDGFGISGFTLGVIGIVFAGTYGLVLAVVGLIFCYIQQKKHKTKFGRVGKNLNIIGIVLSILVILFSIFILPGINEKLALT